MLTDNQRLRSKRLAQRLWMLLPRDEAIHRLHKAAHELRSHPRIDHDLLDISVEKVTAELQKLQEVGHA